MAEPRYGWLMTQGTYFVIGVMTISLVPVAIFSIKTIFVKKVMTVLPVVLALLPPVVVVLTALFPVVVLTAALVVVVLTALVVVVLTVALTAALTAAVVTAALTAALADADEGRLQEVEKKKACVSKYIK